MAAGMVIARLSLQESGINSSISRLSQRLYSNANSELDNPLSENDNIQSQVLNRNPRNLEQLRIGRKPRGWGLEYPSRRYWNKLFFTDASKHVSGRVVHNTGKIIVEASSIEPCVRQFLASPTDKNAVLNVARVLADRCLMAGIIHVHTQFSELELQKEKLRIFLKTMEEGGISLTEPAQYFHTTIYSGR